MPLVQLDTAQNATRVTVSLAGQSTDCDVAEVFTVADALVASHGPGVPSFTYWGPSTSTFSDFEGNLVVDDAAKSRIEGLHAKLVASGVNVDASQQLYGTGTRMAREGYATQTARKAEHERAKPIADAANELADTIRAEGREDIVVSAREFANTIEVNGKITACGFALTEQALRGLTFRIESPAITYLLGLRKRISAEMAKAEGSRDVDAIRGDKAKIAEVLRHESLRNGDVKLKLRTRKGPGDIFAVVGPGFSPADAPEVVDQIIGEMPADARGTWSYDSASTAWELRADVWTPTPVEEQAVGEPFTGYAAFRSRDNGTAKFRGGGGIELIRCLNASVYVADAQDTDRVHRGRVLYDVATMLRNATRAIGTLCEAWGTNRAAVVELPSTMTLEEAIPGFWRHLLSDRRSELQGVLVGRNETHVEGLSRAFHAERRNTSTLVRADFAQGWTRYVQDLPAPVRREGETAIADWLLSSRPLRCDAS